MRVSLPIAGDLAGLIYHCQYLYQYVLSKVLTIPRYQYIHKKIHRNYRRPIVYAAVTCTHDFVPRHFLVVKYDICDDGLTQQMNLT